MQPILLVHGYSAESKSSAPASVARTYQHLPKLLRERFGSDLTDLDLSRYISLEDSITLDDISRGMERALETDYDELRKSGFNIITHSTGALVVRNWLRRYWNPEQECPARRIIHLAGANFGSGWASVGRSQLAKWGRIVFSRSERGMRVLDGLELGSNWTIDMHLELERKLAEASLENRPLEACIVGSQHPEKFQLIPVKYAHEEDADGVVRVASANLNYSYLLFKSNQPDDFTLPDPSAEAKETGFHVNLRELKNPEEVKEVYSVEKKLRSRPCPLAIPYAASHTDGSTSILGGKKNRNAVLPLIGAALDAGPDDADELSKTYSEATGQAREEAKGEKGFATYAFGLVKIRRQSQYNAHAQVVFRIFDQYGSGVEHFNIYFNSLGGEKGDRLINELFRDGHPNSKSRNTITFHLRLSEWSQKDGVWEDLLDQVNGCTISVDATEHGTDEIYYEPFRAHLGAEDLHEWLRPHETTIVDIYMRRLPSSKVFQRVKSP